MSRETFESQYRTWLDQLDEEVDASVWENVQDELDLAEVWQNVSTRLEAVDYPTLSKGAWLSRLGVLVAALLLLPIYSPDVPGTTEKLLPAGGNLVASRENGGAKAGPVAGAERASEHDLTAKPVLSAVSGKAFAEEKSRGLSDSAPLPFSRAAGRPQELRTLTAGSSFEAAGPLVAQLQPSIYPVQLKRLQAMRADSLLRASAEAAGAQSDSLREKPAQNKFSITEAGMIIGYNNTWLLNNETFTGLNPEKLNNTLATYAKQIGVQVTFALKRRPLLGLDFYWTSPIGQNYQRYSNASYMRKDILLDYRKVQLFYIWQPDRFPGQFLLGAYLAHLKTARETLDGFESNQRNHYRKLDYGLLWGYELDLQVHHRLSLKPGLRINYNLQNTFLGDEITPAQFKRTRSLAAGLHIGISYHLKKE